jgi:hypothetical protein
MKKISIFSILCLMAVSMGLRAEPVWKSDFTSLDGWYDNKTDPSFNAVMTMGAKEGTADITQKGEGTWGKVAFVFENQDLDKYNIIRVNVADIQKGAAFKVLAANKDWSESFVVIDRGRGKGISMGNIKDVTGWSGVNTFNLVVVIEGEKKKVTLNSVELYAKEDLPAETKPVPEKKPAKK